MQEQAKKSDNLFDFLKKVENYLHYIKNWLFEKQKLTISVTTLGKHSTTIKGLGPRVWCSLQHQPNTGGVNFQNIFLQHVHMS
jgi:hypothetical protein